MFGDSDELRTNFKKELYIKSVGEVLREDLHTGIETQNNFTKAIEQRNRAETACKESTDEIVHLIVKPIFDCTVEHMLKETKNLHGTYYGINNPFRLTLEVSSNGITPGQYDCVDRGTLLGINATLKNRIKDLNSKDWPEITQETKNLISRQAVQRLTSQFEVLRCEKGNEIFKFTTHYQYVEDYHKRRYSQPMVRMIGNMTHPSSKIQTPSRSILLGVHAWLSDKPSTLCRFEHLEFFSDKDCGSRSVCLNNSQFQPKTTGTNGRMMDGRNYDNRYQAILHNWNPQRLRTQFFTSLHRWAKG